MKQEEVVYFTEQEKERLFKYINTIDEKNALRDRTIIKISYYCALRVSEICNLKLEDINIEEREIRCNRIQNGHNNVLKIVDDDIFSDLSQYYYERVRISSLSENLFVNNRNTQITRVALHNMMKKICNGANIPEEKSHFQVLRYTRAIDLLELGFSLSEMVWWVGLSHVTSSKIFKNYLMKLFSVKPDTSNMYDILERGNNEKKENSES